MKRSINRWTTTLATVAMLGLPVVGFAQDPAPQPQPQPQQEQPKPSQPAPQPAQPAPQPAQPQPAQPQPQQPAPQQGRRDQRGGEHDQDQRRVAVAVEHALPQTEPGEEPQPARAVEEAP